MFKSKHSNWLFAILSTVVIVVTAIRSYLIPFCHDEVATFFFFIQPGDFLPFCAGPDANNHFLNSLLSWICFHLLGDSPFVLRMTNLASLFILIVSVWRFIGYFKTEFSKWLLFCFFLLSYHWLSFFSVCRGYGMSMAFLLLSLSYFCDLIIGNREFRSLLLFLLFIQISIASNLTILIVGVILTVYLVLFLLLKGSLLNIRTIIVLIAHILFIVFWANFSFYLKEKNALYYGAGNSYWEVTFVSLIELIVGSKINAIKTFSVLVFILLITKNIYNSIRNFPISLFDFLKTPRFFFVLIFLSLIICFYLMKALLGINYPEDRTGLFFYLFFVLVLVFTFDILPVSLQRLLAPLVLLSIMFHYAINLNFKKHSLSSYETIPDRFVTRLLDEQKKSPGKISVGGHRVRELFYAFSNYRNGGELNLMDSPETMHMNTDYSIALKAEEPSYRKYYDQIDLDAEWSFVLLKRKEPIQRTPIVELKNFQVMEGSDEYFGFYTITDTTLNTNHPILIEFNLDVISSEKPMQTWLVVDISGDNENSYKRIPLNWLKYDWNNSCQAKYHIISENLPSQIKSLKCYLWNVKQQHVKFRLNTLKIYRLDGSGVSHVVSKSRM